MADSKPFLWLPSAIWFGFLSRRLETLADHQVQLYQRNPEAPNYTVMTGLFSYLMQSVLFTPTLVNPHV
jgi:steroid 5-alpha reductase family enzyme